MFVSKEFFMSVVIVFTSKPFETMVQEGGTGYWSASKKRLEKCSYVIATKSDTLRDHFPGNTGIEQGAAFLIGKISNVTEAPNGSRYVIQFSEYSEINIPDVWTGNRNPVAYTDMQQIQDKYGIDFSALEWKKFPESNIKLSPAVKPLTIDEAKAGLAEALGIDPSCIEIQIRA
jgi:hypothetical protein